MGLVAAIGVVVATAACTTGGSSAATMLRMKPDEPVPATEMGCCADRVGQYVWACRITTYGDCAQVGEACVGEPGGDGYCSYDDWGFTPNWTDQACLDMCGNPQAALRAREAESAQAGGELPPGDINRYQLAEELAREGDCERSEQVLQSLSSRFTAEPLNRHAVELTRAHCDMFGRENVEAAERRGVAAYNSGTAASSNGAYAVAIARTHFCDYDAARMWTFRATESRPSFQPSAAPAQAAILERISGRPDAARRFAEQFLIEFPANWYELPVSEPPPDLVFNRSLAREGHLEARSQAWLIMAPHIESASLTAAEREALGRFIDNELIYAGGQDSAYVQGRGASATALARLALALSGLEGADALNLTQEQRDALRQLADRSRALLASGEPECEPYTALSADRYERVLVPATAEAIDTDGDGLPDADDACPEAAEVFNGIDDSDGCPDQRNVEILERQIAIYDRVLFETASAELLPESHAILGEVASVLDAYPQIRRVRIEGHTDERGEDAYNLDLSQRRAESVRAWLVGAGVAEERLDAVGFGESVPVSLESDEDAWQQNRRVEFTILDADPIRITR